MEEKTGDSPQNDILKRLEQAEKEIATLKNDVKEIRVSLLPKEQFNLMLEMQKETLERQKLNTQYSEERDMRLSRIETTLSTSIIHSMGLAELFVKTSLGALLVKIIAFIFVLISFFIVSVMASIISPEINEFIKINGTRVFTAEALSSLIISVFLTRKGVKKHEEKN